MPRWIIVCGSSVILILFLLLLLLPWQNYLDSEMNLLSLLQGPSWAHPFGTDSIGRDLLVNFSSALKDAVLPLWLAVLGASIAGYIFAVLLINVEAIAAWLRPIVTLTQAVGVSFLSVPLGIFVFLLALYFERAGLLTIIYAMALFAFFRSMLLIFELFTVDRNLEYWQAHVAMGGKLSSRLFSYGILRSWRGSLLANIAFSLSMAISIEAALSYLGFGVQPPQLSFGNILSAHYDQFLHGHFSILFFTLAGMGLCYLVPVAIKQMIVNLKIRS